MNLVFLKFHCGCLCASIMDDILPLYAAALLDSLSVWDDQTIPTFNHTICFCALYMGTHHNQSIHAISYCKIASQIWHKTWSTNNVKLCRTLSCRWDLIYSHIWRCVNICTLIACMWCQSYQPIVMLAMFTWMTVDMKGSCPLPFPISKTKRTTFVTPRHFCIHPLSTEHRGGSHSLYRWWLNR